MPDSPEFSSRARVKQQMTVSVRRAERISNSSIRIYFEWAQADGTNLMVSDIYSVPSIKILTTLLLANAGRRVHAVVMPDGPDKDTLPEIVSASLPA